MGLADQHTALATAQTAVRDRVREVDERFGVQHHTNGTGEWGGISSRLVAYSALAGHYRRINDRLPGENRAWAHILLEEVFEAVSESDPDRLRAELIDVGAVVLAWLRDLELQRSGGTPAERAHNDYANRVF